MFKYNEKDLYDRCGAIDVPYDHNKKPTFEDKFVEVGGEKIPVINFHFQSGVIFTRTICLKTMFGYIPIENINEFKDIFNTSKYCKDDIEWCFGYEEKNASLEDKEKVKKLALTLGKHWNGK